MHVTWDGVSSSLPFIWQCKLYGALTRASLCHVHRQLSAYSCPTARAASLPSLSPSICCLCDNAVARPRGTDLASTLWALSSHPLLQRSFPCILPVHRAQNSTGRSGFPASLWIPSVRGLFPKIVLSLQDGRRSPCPERHTHFGKTEKEPQDLFASLTASPARALRRCPTVVPVRLLHAAQSPYRMDKLNESAQRI